MNSQPAVPLDTIEYSYTPEDYVRGCDYAIAFSPNYQTLRRNNLNTMIPVWIFLFLLSSMFLLWIGKWQLSPSTCVGIIATFVFFIARFPTAARFDRDFVKRAAKLAASNERTLDLAPQSVSINHHQLVNTSSKGTSELLLAAVERVWKSETQLFVDFGNGVTAQIPLRAFTSTDQLARWEKWLASSIPTPASPNPT